VIEATEKVQNQNTVRLSFKAFDKSEHTIYISQLEKTDFVVSEALEGY
jgi:hypothetical protein